MENTQTLATNLKVRVSEQTHAELAELAQLDQRSVSETARRLITNGLAEALPARRARRRA